VCRAYGNGTITASDSLLSLRAAVQENAGLRNCPSVCDETLVRPNNPLGAVYAVTAVDCTP